MSVPPVKMFPRGRFLGRRRTFDSALAMNGELRSDRYTVEAEQVVLGAILADTAHLAVVRDVVVYPERFLLPQHRHIFRAMLELETSEIPINLLSVREHLFHAHTLEDAGGDAYIGSIATEYVRTNVRFYASKVLDAALKRDLANAAQLIFDQALDAGDSVSTVEVVERAKELFARIGSAAEPTSAPAEPEVRDLPENCLDGRLGEICDSYLPYVPRAYSWPAITTVASVLVMPDAEAVLRSNVYTGLIGPVHSGKSVTIQAVQVGFDVPTAQIESSFAGSAEGLLSKIGVRIDPVLLSPDELSHLLVKAQIQNASLPFVLPRLFYYNDVPSIVAGRKELNFSAQVSILGGVVEENFADHFGAASMGGLYDRFMFGHFPTGRLVAYREPPTRGSFIVGEPQPRKPKTNGDVWEWAAALRKESPAINPRVVEIGLRVASICAAFDGRSELRAKDLAPALNYIQYQLRERILLQPNPGKNSDGVLQHRILSHLQACRGEWVLQRDLLRKARGSEFGMPTWNRVVSALVYAGDVEMRDGARRNQKFLRAVL